MFEEICRRFIGDLVTKIKGGAVSSLVVTLAASIRSVPKVDSGSTNASIGDRDASSSGIESFMCVNALIIKSMTIR